MQMLDSRGSGGGGGGSYQPAQQPAQQSSGGGEAKAAQPAPADMDSFDDDIPF